jgi:hypothetical protein
MHHFWKLQKQYIVHDVTSHSGKIKNTKNAEVTLVLPRDNFFPDGSSLDDDKAEDLMNAIEALLNMTSK